MSVSRLSRPGETLTPAELVALADASDVPVLREALEWATILGDPVHRCGAVLCAGEPLGALYALTAEAAGANGGKAPDPFRRIRVRGAGGWLQLWTGTRSLFVVQRSHSEVVRPVLPRDTIAFDPVWGLSDPGSRSPIERAIATMLADPFDPSVA